MVLADAPNRSPPPLAVPVDAGAGAEAGVGAGAVVGAGAGAAPNSVGAGEGALPNKPPALADPAAAGALAGAAAARPAAGAAPGAGAAAPPNEKPPGAGAGAGVGAGAGAATVGAGAGVDAGAGVGVGAGAGAGVDAAPPNENFCVPGAGAAAAGAPVVEAGAPNENPPDVVGAGAEAAGAAAVLPPKEKAEVDGAGAGVVADGVAAGAAAGVAAGAAAGVEAANPVKPFAVPAVVEPPKLKELLVGAVAGAGAELVAGAGVEAIAPKRPPLEVAGAGAGAPNEKPPLGAGAVVEVLAPDALEDVLAPNVNPLLPPEEAPKLNDMVESWASRTGGLTWFGWGCSQGRRASGALRPADESCSAAHRVLSPIFSCSPEIVVPLVVLKWPRITRTSSPTTGGHGHGSTPTNGRTLRLTL